MASQRTQFSRSHRPGHSGFTLVELMVALTVGGLAISAMYSLGSASSRTFHEQLRIANAQSSLRMAMEQVKRDIQRAGYLASPRANAAGESCTLVAAPLDNPTIDGSVAAIARHDDDIGPSNAGGPVLASTWNPGGAAVQMDGLTVIGNYETVGDYVIRDISPGGNQVWLAADWHATRRDFYDWMLAGQADTPNQAIFQDAFVANRLVRVTSKSRKKHWAQVVSSTLDTTFNPKQPTVVFTPAVSEQGCFTGAVGGTITPVDMIRFAVEEADASAAPAVPAVSGADYQLTRTEVNPADKFTALDVAVSPKRVLLDYVVHFNVQFYANTAHTDPATGVNPPDTIARTPATAALISANPEYLRTALIEIGVRTPEQDPRFDPARAFMTDPVRSFQVFPVSNKLAGTARVRFARAEVFLSNVAMGGY